MTPSRRISKPELFPELFHIEIAADRAELSPIDGDEVGSVQRDSLSRRRPTLERSRLVFRVAATSENTIVRVYERTTFMLSRKQAKARFDTLRFAIT